VFFYAKMCQIPHALPRRLLTRPTLTTASETDYNKVYEIKQEVDSKDTVMHVSKWAILIINF